jgi:tetratricopeptide (TPR) repeat protein
MLALEINMRQSVFLPFIICLFVVFASAQKLPKPTQLPLVATAEQEKSIALGNSLHDAKKYDEALAIYDKLLEQSPDLTSVIYEKTLTLYTKGDKTKAMETAYAGAHYKSEQLPLFYAMMASCLDDVGKPNEALDIYRQAEVILKSDVGTQHLLATIYYNMGVTYVRQKKYSEARIELKKAIEQNPTYASPHYVLSMVYNGTKYKVPAFLAAARFLAMEINTDRSKAAALIILDVLKPASKDEKTGNINIFVNMGGPKDEGDYTMYELILGTLTTVRDEKEKNKTDDEMFVSGLDTLIAIIDEDKKLKDTFVGKQYVPFVVELKKKGYGEVFGYMVLYLSGRQDAMKWLEAHDAKLGEFVAWAKSYQLPK